MWGGRSTYIANRPLIVSVPKCLLLSRAFCACRGVALTDLGISEPESTEVESWLMDPVRSLVHHRMSGRDVKIGLVTIINLKKI